MVEYLSLFKMIVEDKEITSEAMIMCLLAEEIAEQVRDREYLELKPSGF